MDGRAAVWSVDHHWNMKLIPNLYERRFVGVFELDQGCRWIFRPAEYPQLIGQINHKVLLVLVEDVHHLLRSPPRNQPSVHERCIGLTSEIPEAQNRHHVLLFALSEKLI